MSKPTISQPMKKIAMWSGPRNLSTAMMYSFAQRNDCSVIDEPFYAAYLKATGIQHAMFKEIISAGETNPVQVAKQCTNDLNDSSENNGASVFYQKHMTKHMIPNFDRQWIHDVCNVFLIREPARVIASYHAKEEDPELSDIGVKEQLELFNQVAQKTGEAPTVVNSYDILTSPKSVLTKLCEAIGIEFQPAMLTWSEGAKSYDGVWAPHWYKSVWQSTGFSSPPTTKAIVPDHLQGLLETANHYYDQIKTYSIS